MGFLYNPILYMKWDTACVRLLLCLQYWQSLQHLTNSHLAFKYQQQCSTHIPCLILITVERARERESLFYKLCTEENKLIMQRRGIKIQFITIYVYLYSSRV